jgi:outer membrane protein TolC
MKRIKNGLIIIVVLALSLTFYPSIGLANTESDSVLTLSKSLDLLEENNLELLSLKRQIELQKVIIEETNDEALRLRNYIRYDEDEDPHVNAIKVFIDPIIEKNTLASLERRIDEKRFELELKLQDYYVELYNMDSKLSLLEDSLEVVNKEYEQLKVRKDLGLIVSTDVDNYETSIKEIERDIAQLKNQYEMKIIEFNTLITGSTDKTYLPNLNDLDFLTRNFQNLDKLSYDELLEAQLKYDDTYKSYEEQLAVLEEQFRVERSFPKAYDYDTLVRTKEDTEFAIKQYELNAKTSIIQAHYEIKNAELDIKLTSNNIKLSQLTVDRLVLRKEQGLATELELLKANLDYANEESAYNEAAKAYQHQMQKYLYYFSKTK